MSIIFKRILASESGTPGATRTRDTRFRKLSATMLNHHFSYKLELLCQWSETCFGTPLRNIAVCSTIADVRFQQLSSFFYCEGMG